VAKQEWSRKHVAHTYKCEHQMGLYVQEPQVGGKQTTCILNHGFTVLLWHTELRVLNKLLMRSVIFRLKLRVVMKKNQLSHLLSCRHSSSMVILLHYPGLCKLLSLNLSLCMMLTWLL
jgi:hypothetical protein